MAETHAPLRCPQCSSLMQQGFIPVSQGMHFIKGDGKGAHHFAEDLPGTHSVMRSNRLLAWRCKACEMVVFKYGRGNAKMLERLLQEDDVHAEPDPGLPDALDERQATDKRR